MAHSYDFSALSPTDFEDLSRDLLQAEFDVRCESFAAGRDSGIDLRYSISGNDNCIIQCKHFAKSGWSKLKSNLRREVPKVQRIAPERYILTTSVGLTPGNKAEIVKLFDPWIKEPSDIFGADDIRNLLGRHPNVEQAHFKLWLTSAKILGHIVNAATTTRTTGLVEELHRQVRLYVSNSSFSRSLDVLNKQHVCIIAGIPGIGKTFLARMLMLHHLEQGYRGYVLSADIEEANQIYDVESHQFFYYDDFLGTAFDDALLKNEDSRLSDFLNRVSRDPNKRIVLTTREYILNQATTRYEKLHRVIHDTVKCIVQLEDYTRLIRGQILYNHLFYSDISSKSIRKFCTDRCYLDVVNHANFSPRLVEFAIIRAQTALSPNVSLKSYMLNVLNNPATLWDHAFKSYLSSDAQSILLAMLFLPTEAPLVDIESTTKALAIERSGRAQTGVDFSDQLRQLDGSFISILIWQEAERSASFFSPAIADYLLGLLQDITSEFQSIIKSAVFFEQVLGIWSAVQSNDVDTKQDKHPRYPHLAEWVRENPTLILDAIDRTWHSLSCRWEKRFSHDGPKMVRTAPDMESRLLKAIEIGTAIAAPSVISWLESRAEVVAINWCQHKGNRAAAAKLLGHFTFNPNIRSAVRNWCLQDLNDANDFDAAIQLIESAPDQINTDFESDLFSRFYQFVDEQEDYVRCNVTDRTEAESIIDKVTYLSSALGVEPSWNITSLRDYISELDVQEDDFDPNVARNAHLGARDGGRNAPDDAVELDRLFDSLLRAYGS